MAAETNFYTLFQVSKSNDSRLVILKVSRPDYSNASQSQEDNAYTVLEHRQESLINNFCKSYGYSNPKLIAEWSGFPEGDVFYSDLSYVEIDVWIAMYKEAKPYFSFGIAKTEEAFWLQLKELYDDGDCANYPDLLRPATQKNIIFIQ